MGKKITIGLVQMRMLKSPQDNLDHAISLISKAAKKGAQIVCLPELFTTPYFAQHSHDKKHAKAFAQPIPGPTTRALSSAAKEHGIVLIGGSIYEKDGSKLFNTSPVFAPSGKLLGIYRKIHIPHDENFFEQDYFAPGNLGFRSFSTKFGKLSPLICYDQWFPEAARSAALMGAQMVFYPTAIGTVKGISQAEGNWQEAWENVMRGHAIANGMIVAAVNRCGTEGKMSFWGGSFVCDAFGKTLARAGGGEEVLIVKVDLQHGKDVLAGWRFFHNRRPDQYAKITQKK